MEAVWKVLVDVGSMCAGASIADALMLTDVGIASDATALELAAERE